MIPVTETSREPEVSGPSSVWYAPLPPAAARLCHGSCGLSAGGRWRRQAAESLLPLPRIRHHQQRCMRVFESVAEPPSESLLAGTVPTVLLRVDAASGGRGILQCSQFVAHTTTCSATIYTLAQCDLLKTDSHYRDRLALEVDLAGPRDG